MNGLAAAISALERQLSDYPAIAVAVSGGVDSLTLGSFAHRFLPERVVMYHAVSPAVPAEATRRVKALAAQERWSLQVIEAGEFDDPNYRTNPVNRCYYCKSNLYGAIARHTSAQIVSGTNTDDLGEYRPGLEAAGEYGVRHPYVDAGIDKLTLREISRWLGLGELAELPASPCLSSRIETDILIEPDTLDLVHALEQRVAQQLKPATVRCRVRAQGLVIELDPLALKSLSDTTELALRRELSSLITAAGHDGTLSFAPYRNGSAFLHEPVIAEPVTVESAVVEPVAVEPIVVEPAAIEQRPVKAVAERQ